MPHERAPWDAEAGPGGESTAETASQGGGCAATHPRARRVWLALLALAGLRLREVTPDGQVVWDLQWEGSGMSSLGRTTPLEDLYAFAP